MNTCTSLYTVYDKKYKMRYLSCKAPIQDKNTSGILENTRLHYTSTVDVG